MSPDANSLSTLSQLATWHGSTLAAYLLNAVPWDAAQKPRAFDAIRGIVHDQQNMFSRFSEEIQQRGGAVGRVAFPMAFTSLHDLSMEYLLGRVRQDQKQLAERIAGTIPALRHDPRALALAEESLGEAEAHLEILA